MVDDTIKGLNPQQADAVQTVQGPMLILAGAGSGKTKVLTCRIAHLLNQGVRPYRILAITFTNKAAAEMRERVDKMAGEAAKDVWLHTFHAFCAKLLRMEIDKLDLGYSKNFTIYDTTDIKNVIKKIIKELNLDDKKYPESSIRSRISNWKNEFLSPDDVEKNAVGFFEHKLAEIYSMYETRMIQNNALDFDDLLLLALNLLQNNAEVRNKYQEKFDYIMVDEYQDTNHVQYLLTKILAEKHQNICVVGDADQSIYGWRGADITNILDFEKDYPNATLVKLEQNYRSTQVILEAANASIKENTGRKEKNLWTNNETGSEIVYYHAVDERDEARFVAEQVKNLQRNANFKLGDMAVLYRTNNQSRSFDDVFREAGLKFKVVGGIKTTDRKEIKDLVSYLRVIFNPYDSLSLLRIINVPRRGIGDATLAKLQAYAEENNMNLFDVVSASSDVTGLSSRFVGKLEELSSIIFDLVNSMESLAVDELIEAVLDRTGYLAELQQSKSVQDQTRIEQLNQFVEDARAFVKNNNDEDSSLENFLTKKALIADIDDTELNEDAITLMTVHSAKGLEFPVVFLVGLEENIFPHRRNSNGFNEKIDEAEKLEEERRLFYVAITRAERYLFMSNAMMRTVFIGSNMLTNRQEPSGFLKEIPRAYIKVFKRPQRERVVVQQNGGQHERRSTNSDWMLKPKASYMPKETNSKVKFSVADKVHHSKWGNGTVVAVKNTDNGQEVAVAFENEGIRNLLTQYAVLKKI